MKTSWFFVACATLITAGNTDVDHNCLHNYQSAINEVTAISKGNLGSSSDYQETSVSITRVNLRQPHILSINTSGSHLQGNITLNGKVIQQIRNKKVYVNLSPYLSPGKHTVKIFTRYFPESSSVSVEFRGPGVNATQQTSGSGTLNYILNVVVH